MVSEIKPNLSIDFLFSGGNSSVHFGRRRKRQDYDEYDDGMYSDGSEENSNYDMDDGELKRKKRMARGSEKRSQYGSSGNNGKRVSRYSRRN